MDIKSSIGFITMPGTYTIHRIGSDMKVPELIKGFYSVTVTGEEISVVCSEEIELPSEKESTGWKCLKVSGPLELDLVGILHDISRPLKDAGISVFVISTYDTDYLLVPGKSYLSAIEVLAADYQII